MNQAAASFQRRRVLFLCAGNSARSQMAEGFLRALGGERFEAYSAGLHPNEINPLTRQAMQERGIDMRGQRSKSLDEYLGRKHFDVLITVCDRAAAECPSFPDADAREHWSVRDPVLAEGSDYERLLAFRAARDEIEARVRAWLAAA